MGSVTLQTILSVGIQVVLTGIVGWLVHKLTAIRSEWQQFMKEHEFLLRTARRNSAAVLRLGKRLDRLERTRG